MDKRLKKLLKPRKIYNGHNFAYTLKTLLTDIRDGREINTKDENLDYYISIIDSIIKEEKEVKRGASNE